MRSGYICGMIKENELNLTDEEVAYAITRTVLHRELNAFAIQLFIEQLVVPEDVNSYSEEELYNYLLEFMRKFDEANVSVTPTKR